jgi:hypothetical protein
MGLVPVPVTWEINRSSAKTPAERLVYNTVRLQCEFPSGMQSVGTAFFFYFARNGDQVVPGIVTNKHVVVHPKEGPAVKGSFLVHRCNPDSSPSMQSERIIVDDFPSRWIHHPEPNVDLCVLPIAHELQKAVDKGVALHYTPLHTATAIPSDREFAAFSPLEDVLMVGYPIDVWDSTNNMPILRRGITATHPGIDYRGEQEFLIDAACFRGSSGSPIMLYSIPPIPDVASDGTLRFGAPRVKLLGILYAGPLYTVTGELKTVPIPTALTVQAESRIPTNLGQVIRSTRLRYFDDLLKKRLAT